MMKLTAAVLTAYVVAATGRFAGVRGGDTMTGRRAGKIGDDVLNDYEISLKMSD